MADSLYDRFQEDEVKGLRHPLRVYLYYRILLAASFLVLFFLSKQSTLHTAILYFTCFSYVALNILTLTLLRIRSVPSGILTFLAVMIDIIAITTISYCRSETGNFDILLGVSVAAGNILLVGEIGFALAAIATVASGFEQLYDALINSELISSDTYWRIAVFGVALFGIALISQQLSKRMRASEALADQRAVDLAELEKLNEHIIQRMRTGILVVNSTNQLLLMNESAWRMLGNPKRERFTNLEKMCPILCEQLDGWRNNPELRGKPFKALQHCPEVSASFSALYGNTKTQVLIFLDDNSRLTQHAQQLKLASLGRLTAGIAHEIRNPLGAISHAAQLLGESYALEQADVRLAEIIQNHSLRMNKVIENVLQLSRRKQANPELLEIKDWLEQLRNDFNLADSTQNEIQIEVKPQDLKIRMDASHLQQALTNLWQNGLRYSEKKTGQRILLVRAGITKETERPFIEIEDKGSGIPAEIQAHLFEPFTTSEITGTGLGLYISRELCEANEARLEYVPDRDGACFRIIFPHPGRILAV